MFQIHHMRETPVKNKKKKITIYKGMIVKIVIFHAPHCYIFLLSSGPLLCVRSVCRDPGGKELHGILQTVPPSCRGTVLLVNLDILLQEIAHSSPSGYPYPQGKGRTLPTQAESLHL